MHSTKSIIGTGSQLVTLAAKHVGEKYVLGAIAPKANPNYHGPWDCAEFTSWNVYQVSGSLYGCANNSGNPNSADAYSGFWGRDANVLGTKISINEAYQTVGACLLRLAGHGMIGHIVFSDGIGGTIEAHSSKKGVIKSVVTGRRWDMGILVPWIDYSKVIVTPNVDEVNEKPTEIIYRYKIPMMRGPKIKAIQKAVGVNPIDGVFGLQTFNAVRQFQLRKGLVPDGEVGPKTLKALGLL